MLHPEGGARGYQLRPGSLVASSIHEIKEGAAEFGIFFLQRKMYRASPGLTLHPMSVFLEEHLVHLQDTQQSLALS